MVTGIAGVVLGILALLLFVASAVNPSVDTAPRQTLRATSGLDELGTDLYRTWSVNKVTSTELELITADTSGDGFPDRVRYRWTGTPNTPLLREFAGRPDVPFASPRVLVPRVVELSFQTHSPATPLELTPINVQEVLIDAFTPTAGSSVRLISPASHVAQLVVPSTTTSSATFRITRVSVRMYRTPDMTGSVVMQVFPAGGSVPTGNPFLRQVISSAELPLSPDWVDFPIVNAPTMTAASHYVLTLTPASSQPAALVQWAESAPSPGGKASFSTNSGASWTTTTGAVLFRVYGHCIGSLTSPAFDPVRPRLEAVSVVLRVGAPGTPSVHHHFQVPNRPFLP